MTRKINPLEDGVTHVNIYSQGRTTLGKMLSNWQYYSLNTKDDGRFSSIEGYWFWLGTNDCPQRELLRKLDGYQAKELGEKLRNEYGKRHEPDFQHKILNAIEMKINDNIHLFRNDIAKLPFEHYYVYDNTVVDVKNKYKWLIDGIDRLRCAALLKV